MPPQLTCFFVSARRGVAMGLRKRAAGEEGAVCTETRTSHLSLPASLSLTGPRLSGCYGYWLGDEVVAM